MNTKANLKAKVEHFLEVLPEEKDFRAPTLTTIDPQCLVARVTKRAQMPESTSSEKAALRKSVDQVRKNQDMLLSSRLLDEAIAKVQIEAK